jgi:hypothetical protein
MSLSSLSVQTGGTVSVTGGSALTWKADGAPVGDSVTLYCVEDTDLRTRRSLHITVKRPKVSASAPNGFTQPRVLLYYKQPFVLDNGATTTFTWKGEVSYDAEALYTEVDDLCEMGAQFMFNTNMNAVFTQLSLAQ